MNLFTWLIVGHLVGDWILQNDWMARGKKGRLLALPGLVHYTVYTATVMVTLWLAVGSSLHLNGYILVMVVVFITHMLTDATNIVGIWMHFYRQTDIPMVRVMVDQTLHVVELTLVAQLVLFMI